MKNTMIILALFMSAFAFAEQQQNPIRNYKGAYGRDSRSCYTNDFLACKFDLTKAASLKAIRVARGACEAQDLTIDVLANHSGCNPEVPNMNNDEMNLPTHVECWAEVIYKCQ